MADIQKAIASFEKNGFSVKYFEKKEQAAQYLLENITGKSVACGGSVTLAQMDFVEELKKSNCLIWHQPPYGYYNEPTVRMSQNAQVYLSGVNAASEDGVIVNIDGGGNRVSMTAYGPQELYYVMGANKICSGIEDAIWRARNVAAPKNSQRLKRKTPCAEKGDKCYDCDSPDRICSLFLFTAKKPGGIKKAEIIIIGEELGC